MFALGFLCSAGPLERMIWVHTWKQLSQDGHAARPLADAHNNASHACTNEPTCVTSAVRCSFRWGRVCVRVVEDDPHARGRLAAAKHLRHGGRARVRVLRGFLCVSA